LTKKQLQDFLKIMRLHANIIFGFLVDSCPVIFEEKGYIYISSRRSIEFKEPSTKTSGPGNPTCLTRVLQVERQYVITCEVHVRRWTTYYVSTRKLIQRGEVLICNKTMPPSTPANELAQRYTCLVRACACSTLTVQCLWKIPICNFS
jgi:hypothetical protein